jgi:hypothetical protein
VTYGELIGDRQFNLKMTGKARMPDMLHGRVVRPRGQGAVSTRSFTLILSSSAMSPSATFSRGCSSALRR